MSIAIVQAASGPVNLRKHDRLERAEGTCQIRLGHDGSKARLLRVYQQGALRVRFPRAFGSTDRQAVLLNIAGGMAGGDDFHVAAEVDANASLTVTTQTAERVYRTLGEEARLTVKVHLDAGARLEWLPQETILFDGGKLQRRLVVEMAETAELVLCEAVVLGRQAYGESVRTGALRDFWTIRRGDRLVYADALRLDCDIADTIRHRATLAGARAFASLLLVSKDAEKWLDPVRTVLDRHATAGASAWDGVLAVRVVAADGARLRNLLVAVLTASGIVVPREWVI